MNRYLLLSIIYIDVYDLFVPFLLQILYYDIMTK
jgi:hypothetical protein